MTTSNSGSKGRSNTGSKGGGRGPSSHPGPGGNWPSTVPRGVSGRGRGNAPAKGKITNLC